LNPKHWNNRLWFLLSLAITTWGAGHLMTILTNEYSQAKLAIYIVYIGAAFIPALFYNFVIIFTLRYFWHRLTIARVGYLLAVILLFLILATKYIVQDVKITEPFGYHEDFGPLFFLFLLYFFFYVGAGVRLLYQTFKDSDGFRQHQMYWILVASVIAFTGGATNFFYDFYSLHLVYPWGHLIVWVYPILITYGIFAPTIKIGSKF